MARYSFFLGHTFNLQLAFKRSSVSRIDMKISSCIGFRLARGMVMLYWLAETLFWQLSINHNMDVQYERRNLSLTLTLLNQSGYCPLTRLPRVCTGVRSYAHVTTNFSRLAGFTNVSYPWCSAAAPLVTLSLFRSWYLGPPTSLHINFQWKLSSRKLTRKR